MTDAILTLNAGSSSLKFSLFEASNGALTRLADGGVTGIGDAPSFEVRRGGEVVATRRWPEGEGADQEAFLGEILGWAETHLGGPGQRGFPVSRNGGPVALPWHEFKRLMPPDTKIQRIDLELPCRKRGVGGRLME